MASRRHTADLLNTIAIATAVFASVIALTVPHLVRAPIPFRAEIYGINLATLFAAAPLLVFAIILSARGSASARLLAIGGLAWLLSAHASLLTGIQIGAMTFVYAAVFGASLGALLIGIGISLTETTISESMRTPFAFTLALSFSLVLGAWLLDCVRHVDALIHIVLFGLAAPLVWRRAAFGAVVASIAVGMTGIFGASEIAQTLYLWQKGIPPTWIALAVPTTLIAIAIGTGAIMVRALDNERTPRADT